MAFSIGDVLRFLPAKHTSTDNVEYTVVRANSHEILTVSYADGRGGFGYSSGNWLNNNWEHVKQLSKLERISIKIKQMDQKFKDRKQQCAA